MKRKWKIVCIACGVMALLGLLMIFGTAGASDFDNISTGQAVFQASIGFVLFAVGLISLEGVMK